MLRLPSGVNFRIALDIALGGVDEFFHMQATPFARTFRPSTSMRWPSSQFMRDFSLPMQCAREPALLEFTGVRVGEVWPVPMAFASRSSSGSIPRARASLSMVRSRQNVYSRWPNPLKDVANGWFVYTQ
ncbi:MAG: hypothetical protein BWY85_01630 [Firmicutes bacterium ADurb.Bin506]|nr:MAG: hypothetical protein BWY85_01630 [Firmicutes bacterium ADurb.Bin506]